MIGLSYLLAAGDKRMDDLEEEVAKLQSECERLEAENEKAKEQGAREMAELLTEGYPYFPIDIGAASSSGEAFEFAMQLWEEWRKGREKRKL